MSHIATIEIEVKDLDALGKAAQELGCELVRGVNSYKWYGVSVGDYPLPQGFEASDLGKCEHVLRVKGAGPKTYEIGVVARRDGKPGFVLLYDFWMGGYGLVDKVGKNADALKQAYAVEVAYKAARKQKLNVVKSRDSQGRVILTCQ